jgi:hypothetical protein
VDLGCGARAAQLDLQPVERDGELAVSSDLPEQPVAELPAHAEVGSVCATTLRIAPP